MNNCSSSAQLKGVNEKMCGQHKVSINNLRISGQFRSLTVSFTPLRYQLNCMSNCTDFLLAFHAFIVWDPKPLGGSKNYKEKGQITSEKKQNRVV